MRRTAAILTALLAAAVPSAAELHGQQITVETAVVIAKDDVLVPARDAGSIREILAVEGQYVQAGQVLAQLDDADVAALRKTRALELELAIEQAKSNVEELAAIATYNTAREELVESLEINAEEPGAVAESQVRRQKLQAERARLQAEVAREERKIATLQTYVREAEVETADIAIARRKILSPIDGKVVQVARRPGEWLQPGDPLLRVVRMDVLRVEGFVQSADALPYEVEGLPVKITVLSPRGNQQVNGVVAFANPVLAGQRGRYRVVAELQNVPHPTLENTYLINPGMPAEMSIDLDDSPLPGGSAPDAPGLELPGNPPPAAPGGFPPLGDATGFEAG